MALDGASHRGLAFGAERFAVGAHPVHRLRAPGVALLEARQHIAREELVGALGRFPIGPVMGEQQDAAKAAGLAPVILQDAQCVIGCADRTPAALVDRLDARHADRRTALGVDRIGIELPLLEAGAGILDRLLAGLGEVKRRHDPVVLAVHDATLPLRLGIGEFPVVVKCVVAVRAAGHHAQHAEVVAPGELAAIRGDSTGDRQMRARL